MMRSAADDVPTNDKLPAKMDNPTLDVLFLML